MNFLLKVVAAAAVAATGTAAAAPVEAWPDGFTGRVEALAILQTLNSELLSHDSATLTLDRWCGDHRLAAPAKIVARRMLDVDKPASAEQRRLLNVGDGEPLRYRKVQLLCGERVLSEADNWYVPGRLTSEMNHVLDTSDVAFGRAVQGLHFTRHTLSADLLWSPLPKGWEMQPATAPAERSNLSIPSQVLEHRAILVLPNGTPFSEVDETYTSEVLAFSVARPTP